MTRPDTEALGKIFDAPVVEGALVDQSSARETPSNKLPAKPEFRAKLQGEHRRTGTVPRFCRGAAEG